MKTTPVRRPGEEGVRRSAELSRWLLALSIAGSALAIGSVHTITLCVLVFVLAAAAVCGWWGGEPMSPRPGATLLFLAGVGLTAYTALQCVPMPMRWLSVLAPHNADVWSRALTPLREPGPAWAPLTLDPVATHIEVLKGVAYVLAFVTAFRVARLREGARFLGGAIVLTGLVLATAALLHPAFGAHKVFGIYEPGPGIDQRHIAPFLNPNNLAGYLNLALCLALAAMLAPEPAVPRPILAAVVLLLGGAQLWVASRAGVVAMGLGLVLVLAIAQIDRSQPRPQRAAVALSLITGLVATAGATMIVLAGSDEASSELLNADTSKLKMFGQAMRMLPAVPLFGSGRGTFESAFYAFRTDVGNVTFVYPENVLAQWVLEWGLADLPRGASHDSSCPAPWCGPRAIRYGGRRMGGGSGACRTEPGRSRIGNPRVGTRGRRVRGDRRCWDTGPQAPMARRTAGRQAPRVIAIVGATARPRCPSIGLEGAGARGGRRP